MGEPAAHRGYRMETAFPFILQNIHRYFLYLATIPLFFLWVDAFSSAYTVGHLRLGLGVGIFLVNVTLLTGYSLSCHSARHFAGGRMDCFSCTRRPAGPPRAVAAAHVAQPPPHGVGVGEPDLGDPGRRLRPAPGPGRHHRPRHPAVIDRRPARRSADARRRASP